MASFEAQVGCSVAQEGVLAFPVEGKIINAFALAIRAGSLGVGVANAPESPTRWGLSRHNLNELRSPIPDPANPKEPILRDVRESAYGPRFRDH